MATLRTTSNNYLNLRRVEDLIQDSSSPTTSFEHEEGVLSSEGQRSPFVPTGVFLFEKEDDMSANVEISGPEIEELDDDDETVPPEETEENDQENNSFKNPGYGGKYDWDGPMEATKAPEDVMGAKIVDYAWSDGTKKVSVYVTLEGLDQLPDDALEATSEPAKVSFTAAFPNGKRWLDLSPTFGEVAGVKIIRKQGKDQVVLKLEKKKQNEWYDLLKPANMSGGFADDDDDDDFPTDDFDLEDPNIGTEPDEPVNKGDAGDDDLPDLDSDDLEMVD